MAFDHVFELLPGEVVVEIMAMPRPVRLYQKRGMIQLSRLG